MSYQHVLGGHEEAVHARNGGSRDECSVAEGVEDHAVAAARRVLCGCHHGEERVVLVVRALLDSNGHASGLEASRERDEAKLRQEDKGRSRLRELLSLLPRSSSSVGELL